MGPGPNQRSVELINEKRPSTVPFTDLIDLDQDARVTKFVTKLVVSIAGILPESLIFVVEWTVFTRRRSLSSSTVISTGNRFTLSRGTGILGVVFERIDFVVDQNMKSFVSH